MLASNPNGMTCLENRLFTCSVCVCDQVCHSLKVDVPRLLQSLVHSLNNKGNDFKLDGQPRYPKLLLRTFAPVSAASKATCIKNGKPSEVGVNDGVAIVRKFAPLSCLCRCKRGDCVCNRVVFRSTGELTWRSRAFPVRRRAGDDMQGFVYLTELPQHCADAVTSSMSHSRNRLVNGSNSARIWQLVTN